MSGPWSLSRAIRFRGNARLLSGRLSCVVFGDAEQGVDAGSEVERCATADGEDPVGVEVVAVIDVA